MASSLLLLLPPPPSPTSSNRNPTPTPHVGYQTHNGGFRERAEWWSLIVCKPVAPPSLSTPSFTLDLSPFSSSLLVFISTLVNNNNNNTPPHRAAAACFHLQSSTSLSGQPASFGEKSSSKLCIIEFDGSSKGNPGKAGAGVVMRDKSGDLIHRVSEGLGKATGKEAEYRSLARGLKCALDDGFDDVHVRGESELVTKQVCYGSIAHKTGYSLMGKWKVKSGNLTPVCKEVKELKAMFKRFDMDYIMREKFDTLRLYSVFNICLRFVYKNDIV
ncbi:hypothetical protein LWI28_022912 [Acer negundo]|uniref:RNase H type-1 domain-containing protein n=1 Tax=Acer negundo TaxID=4023 RepID=A0AAD5IW57_ACENE|nr:hypothetical protein LWI28_022912 [Acer negundo]